MLQDKGIKKIQELKAEYTPSWVNIENIFSRFKALKLSEGFSEFKEFKTRGFDFKNVLSVLVSMVVSPEKTVQCQGTGCSSDRHVQVRQDEVRLPGTLDCGGFFPRMPPIA